MKHQTTNPKSAITSIKSSFLLAACLILAALGPPAAELSRAQGNGSPPIVFTQNVTFPGICGFDVQATVTGKEGVISLPSGGSIETGPATFGTFTNLSDLTKNVTLNITGVFHISFDQNGNTIVTVTGRDAAADPSFGLVLLVGEFTLVFDPQGNIISGPTGNGQIINICQLID
jgi:hypothetical protein